MFSRTSPGGRDMGTKQSSNYLKEVIEVLKPHQQKEETLNRLFLKHIRARRNKYGEDFVNRAPWLKKNNVDVTVEHFPTDHLKALIELRDKPPHREDTPVVIVRYRDQDCLIYGGKRISKWSREGNTDDHPAYVVTVRE